MKVNRAVRREKWWQFAERASKLYRTIAPLERVLVNTAISKHLLFAFYPIGIVFNQRVFVFSLSSYNHFAILQSNIHEVWARKYSSTLETRLSYSSYDCFETYPFPSDIELRLGEIGERYYEYRRQLMLKMQLGLTKTYNQFHNKQLSVLNGNLSEKEIEKQYSKETLNLWNHLKRTENTCLFNEAVEGVIELRRLHKEVDETVLKAYGWMDIKLAHDFFYKPLSPRI